MTALAVVLGMLWPCIDYLWCDAAPQLPHQNNSLTFYHDWVFLLESVRNCSNSNIFPVQQAGLVYWGTMHVVHIRRRWTPGECVSGHLAKALQARDCSNTSAAPRDAMRKWQPSRTGRSSTLDVNCIRLVGTWNECIDYHDIPACSAGHRKNTGNKRSSLLASVICLSPSLMYKQVER
jgi:hypothetical protein